MKYTTVLFDYGDTLYNMGRHEIPEWVPPMIDKLYTTSYRLGIISNTHRYQDAYWIREKLAKYHISRYFEVVISSAIYGYSKPDMKIFQKAIDFMEVDPSRCVMIGDSEHCDGGSLAFGMTYMHVEQGERWDMKLYRLLEENFDGSRKLSRLTEFFLDDSKLVIRARHLSEPLKAGDKVLLDATEYEVVSIPHVTKEVILGHAGKDYIELQVKKVPPKTASYFL